MNRIYVLQHEILISRCFIDVNQKKALNGVLGSALGADTFYNVVHLSGNEAFGQVDVRYQVFVQAVGVLADFAIEVAVGLFFVAVSVVVADAVFV